MTVRVNRGGEIIELPEEEAQISAPTISERRASSRITFARLLRGLFRSGTISGPQLLGWSDTGALPTEIVAALDGLPFSTDQQIEFKIQVMRELKNAETFGRLDASIAMLQNAFGFSDAQLDAFFGV